MRTAILIIVLITTLASAALAGEDGDDFISELDRLLADPAAQAAPHPERLSAPARVVVTPAPARSATAVGDLYPEVRVKVTSLRHVILSSQAAGRVDTVAVRNGHRFEKGDVLVEIDPTFERIQLDRARANLRRQEIVYRMTEELVRLQTRGELELEIVKTDIDQAKAEVDLLTARLERMRIVAPFAGRAGEVGVRELQIVADGQPLLEIIDEDAMELEFIVASGWMRWFTPGFEFTVHIDELGKTYRAALERLGGKVDPLSKSVNAYARLLDADGALMEGMSGEAFITPPEEAETPE